MATTRFNEPTDFRFDAQKIVVASDDVGPVVLTPAPLSSIRGRLILERGSQGVTSR